MKWLESFEDLTRALQCLYTYSAIKVTFTDVYTNIPITDRLTGKLLYLARQLTELSLMNHSHVGSVLLKRHRPRVAQGLNVVPTPAIQVIPEGFSKVPVNSVQLAGYNVDYGSRYLSSVLSTPLLNQFIAIQFEESQ